MSDITNYILFFNFLLNFSGFMSLVFRSEVFKIAYNYMDAQSTNLFC